MFAKSVKSDWKRLVLLALAGPLAGALVAGPAAAQDDAIDPAAVLAELQAVRAENAQMRREMDELRYMNDDNWLTEERADEIRNLVADVLADADTRASYLSDGLNAGWSDHFFLASSDGKFKLEFDGQLQFRYILNHRDFVDRWRGGFEVTRTKLTLRGHVFNPNLTYFVRMDETRNEPGLVNGLFFVRDAWVAYQLYCRNQW